MERWSSDIPAPAHGTHGTVVILDFGIVFVNMAPSPLYWEVSIQDDEN